MANNTDWLNISQMTGGTGETALSLTALTNNSLESKTATITARNTQYNVSDTTTVTIQGFQPTLTLSRSTLRFDSTGGTATFTVYSNTAWTINFPAIVHSYSTSAGTGDTEVTVVLAQNLDEVGKVDTGTVQDIFGVNQLYLTIVQESFITELTVTPDDDITFVNTGSSTSITIDTNTDWEIEYPAWVTPSITSGESGTTTVTFTVEQNGPTDRSGEIIVYAGSKSVTINVFQPFYIPPYITVTPSAWTFNYTEDGKSFVVDSYPEWTAEIVSTGETIWSAETYMEAVFVIPSAMTMPLWVGNSGSTTGIYLGPIKHYGSSVTFSSSGTYLIRYEMQGNGTTPVLQGNKYLKEVVLNDGVGAIQSSAFTGCTELSSVTIGSGLTRVGAAAFSGCSKLNNITITAPTAPSICASTFYGVATGGTLHYPVDSDYSAWLSTSTYYLGHYFWNGIDLDSLIKVATITYNVTSTTSPTKILSNSTEVVGVMYKGVFNLFPGQGDDYGNTGYTFSSTGKQSLDIYYWKDASSEKSDLTYNGITYKDMYIRRLWLSGLTNITDIVFHQLPDNQYINLQAGTLNSISSVTINGLQFTNYPGIFRNAKIMNIGGNAILTGVFQYYSGSTVLTDMSITSSAVTSIPRNYLSGVTSLTSITITSPIVTIGQYAFDYNGFESISFPSTLTNIGYCSFLACPLKTIRISAVTAPTLSSSAFKGVTTGGVLYYPSGSDYSSWLSTSEDYLGYYDWTGQEI